MARKGRPAKKGERYADGKLKKPTIAQLEQMERERREREKAVVLAQPHRKGDTDQKCASALGRFCLAHKLRQELYDCGEDYSALLRRWRAAKGVPTEERLGLGGNGIGPSDETVAGWTKKLAALRHAIVREAGPLALLLVEALAVDDRDVAAGEDQNAIDGLMALAVEFGAIRPHDLCKTA